MIQLREMSQCPTKSFETWYVGSKTNLKSKIIKETIHVYKKIK